MMKTSVKLSALVLFLYIHSAVGLQCWSCGGGSCSSPTSVTCSSGQTLCVSKTTKSSFNNGNDENTQTSKGCASASDCTAAGSEVVSFNYGSRSYVTNTTCCDSDNCNNETQSTPPVGSLKCYGCDPFSYECTASLSCNTQEVCGQAVFTVEQYGSPRPFHSCVSENLCNNPTLSQQYFGDGTPVSCCKTSNCNVPDLGLQCMTCTDRSCSSQRSVTCSKLAPFCFSLASAGSNSYGNDSYSNSEIRKGCTRPGLCTAAGSEFTSHNYGSSSVLTNLTCCDTDDCNTPDPSLSAPPAGSLQCYGYDSRTKEVTANVTCNSQETCSFISDGTNSAYGCVSENVCANRTVSQGYTNSIVICCNTNHCNVPQVPPRATDRPLITTEDPPDSKEDEDGSVFSGAVQVLSPALLLSLLLCVLMFNFTI